MPLHGALALLAKSPMLWAMASYSHRARLPLLHRPEFVFDVVEEIFSVVDEFAFGVEGETLAERCGSAFVQRVNVELRARCATVEFVGGEFGAPAERVPNAGVLRPESGCSFDEREPFGVLATAGDEVRGHVLERFDIVGIEIERALHQLDARGDIVGRLEALRLGEKRTGFVWCVRQCGSSSG